MKLKNYEMIWLFFMSLASIAVGWIYAVHQTDVHHWGFIAGTALDYIQGKSPYSELYVQYGIGQPILFKFLNNFLTINYTTLGIITDFIYALNLIVIYFSVRKLSCAFWAIIITASALFIHSLAIYPWPDYYAGLFLSLACFSLIKSKDSLINKTALISGTFLFLAFIFRNTYIINFSAAFIAYALLSLFFKQVRSKRILIAIGVFFLLVFCFFSIIFLQGNLQNWFSQTLEIGQSEYGVFNPGPIFLLLRHIFLPNKPYLPANLVTTTWSFLFYLGFYSIFISTLIKDHKIFKDFKFDSGLLLFFSLIGLAGTSQTMVIWEGFRLQNACSPLYLMFAIFIAYRFPDFKTSWNNRGFKFVVLFYLVILAARFPHGSTFWPLYEGSWDSYSESKIPYFKYHRFVAEDENYYSEMRKYLCDGKSKIINLTLDSTIPFLCEGQKNGLVLPFYVTRLKERNDPLRILDVKAGVYSSDQIIVSEDPMVANPKVKLIELVALKRPTTIRWYGTTTIRLYRVENQN